MGAEDTPGMGNTAYNSLNGIKQKATAVTGAESKLEQK